MFEPLTAALSVMANAAGVHSWFTGLHLGRENRRLIEEVSRMRFEVERLADRILYVPSLKEVRDISASRGTQLEERRAIAGLLAPLQSAVGDEIVASAIISTPERLRSTFTKDPWEVLFSIRPLGKIKRPPDVDAVPVIFSEDGSYYAGWQMKGMLPDILGFEYQPAITLQSQATYRPSVAQEASATNQVEKSSSVSAARSRNSEPGINFWVALPIGLAAFVAFVLSGVLALAMIIDDPTSWAGKPAIAVAVFIGSGAVLYAVDKAKKR